MNSYSKRILLFFFLLAGCHITNAARIVVCGKFTGQLPQSVSFQYHATLQGQTENRPVILSQKPAGDGTFKFVLENTKPVFLQMSTDKEMLFYNKFILPGDSIFFSLSDTGIGFDGKGAAALGLQFSFDNQFYNKDSMERYQQAKGLPDHMAFAACMNSILDARIKFLTSHFNAEMPELFRKTIVVNQKLIFLQDMLKLSWRVPIGQTALRDSAYWKYIRDVGLDNPDYFLSPDYAYLLRELTFSLWVTMKADAAQAIVDSLYRNQYQVRESIARQYFKGEAYDNAVYAILSDQIAALKKSAGTPAFGKQYKDADDLVRKLGARLNDKDLYRRAIMLLEALNERTPAPDFAAIDLEGKAVKLSDLKNKVIYIDVWATNCLPCIEQLPYIRQMQERYRENKDIVLLYVSLDKDSALLKRFLKQKSFQGMHWQDPREFSSEIAQQYNISGIPRYIVIDKKGLLVTADASRPGNDPYTLLDLLLKE